MVYEWLEAGLRALRGVEVYEVGQVLHSKTRRPIAAVGPDGHVLLTIWGRTDTGRPLIVFTRKLGAWDRQILGAREMAPREAAEVTFTPGAGPEDLPPADDEVLVPRSFKLPADLDTALQSEADQQGVSKSALVRRLISTGLAAERAGRGEDTLVPVSAVLQAISKVAGIPAA